MIFPESPGKAMKGSSLCTLCVSARCKSFLEEQQVASEKAKLSVLLRSQDSGPCDGQKFWVAARIVKRVQSAKTVLREEELDGQHGPLCCHGSLHPEEESRMLVSQFQFSILEVLTSNLAAG